MSDNKTKKTYEKKAAPLISFSVSIIPSVVKAPMFRNVEKRIAESIFRAEDLSFREIQVYF